MSCDELSELYELYALGALEAEEKAELDAHLARGCDVCRRGVNQALATNAAILSFAPGVEPPARLRRRVLAAVGVERPSWTWTASWAAVTAGLLICALWFSVEAERRREELAAARLQIARASADLAQVRQALAFLNEPETRQVGFGKGEAAPPRGNVFVNPRQGVLLVASKLPAAPAGKRYEMWVIPKKGAPRPAGLFQSDDQGAALHIQVGPLDVADTGAVAVTLEPENGSAAPTSTPIIVAPLAGP